MPTAPASPAQAAPASTQAPTGGAGAGAGGKGQQAGGAKAGAAPKGDGRDARSTTTVVSAPMSKSLEGLRKLATDDEVTPPEKPAIDRPTEPPVDGKTDGTDAKDGKNGKDDKPPEKPSEKTEEIDPKTGKPVKVSPWKLVESYRSRVATLEKDLLDARSKITDGQSMEAVRKELESATKRNQELEDEIRFVNYSKSQEFADKFARPYEEAWHRAVGEVQQLKITSQDGSTRAATPNDLLALANSPLDQIDELAEAWFGKSAARVIRHVERIRDLADAQSRALDEARKSGSERHKELAQTHEKIHAEVGRVWTEALAQDAEKLEWLQAKEGDDEWNGKLQSATELVSSAFAANARDPKLTAEQRAEIVRKHVAIRNRAIAYTPLKLELARVRTQLAAANKELEEFKKSAPTGGNGGPRDGKGAVATDPMEAAKQRLRGYVT